jgi:(p)ppGpp synthase/HD superfamily hydrolase
MEVKINDRILFKDFEAERAEKMASLCSDSSYSEKKFLDLLSFFNRKEENIFKALEYAKSLDFSKNHLRSSYLSHPLRLASYLTELDPTIHSDYIVIALLHNVPETTEIAAEELKKIFGERIANGIDTLVVNRSVPFASIQKSYYKAIFGAGTSLVLIKLLDKIDNIFVLCLNADNEVRKNYIEEIREELLPFAINYNPDLGKYLEALLNVTDELGYSDKLKQELTAYQKSLS